MSKSSKEPSGGRRWGCIGVALAVVALPFVAYGFVQYRISNPPFDPQPLPGDLVAADSGTGRLLLANAEAKADHAPLTRWFVPQEKLSWCGVASSTIVLNALDIKPPKGDSWQQHRLFTRGASAVKSRFSVTFGGMTLAQLEGILDANGAAADTYYADANPLDRFRAMAEGNLGSASDFLIVNYTRPSLGQQGGGHISPVAAWDRDTDRFLVLDTASYKYPWTWVRGVDLHAAMNTVDPDGGKSRGWVVVRRAR